MLTLARAAWSRDNHHFNVRSSPVRYDRTDGALERVDLRNRAVFRVMAGEKVRSVAAVLEVSVASVVKWSQLFRRTGSVALGPMHGHKPRLLLAHRDSLLARTANDQPFTLRGLRAELAERCVVVDDQTVWTFVHAEGLSFKKSVLPREQDRPDIARKRAFWKKHQACVDPRQAGLHR